MKYSHKYFENIYCKYYPCHNLKNMSCLFCYCPLYNFNDCGGKYKILKNGIKDCSQCVLPHMKKGYDYIIRFIKRRNNENNKHKKKQNDN